MDEAIAALNAMLVTVIAVVEALDLGPKLGWCILAGLALLTLFANRRGANAAEDQLEILKHSSTKVPRPHVHAETIPIVHATGLPGLAMRIGVTNVGDAHAVAVRGYLHHPEIHFVSTPTNQIGDIAANKHLYFEFGPAGAGRVQIGPTIAKLWLEYADLDGNKWATAQQIRIVVGESTVKDAPQWTCSVSILSDTERWIGPLEHFYIETHVLRSDDKGIPWPGDWQPLPGHW